MQKPAKHGTPKVTSKIELDLEVIRKILLSCCIGRATPLLLSAECGSPSFSALGMMYEVSGVNGIIFRGDLQRWIDLKK